MKISINKSRFAAALVSLGALVIMAGLIAFVISQQRQIATLQIKLHAVPTNPIVISPEATITATPTASLKFYPTKGIVK